MDDGKDGFEMGTGGNFWYNSTICCKNVNLRNDDVTQNVSAVFDYGCGGFVAGTFDAEDVHCCNYTIFFFISLFLLFFFCFPFSFFLSFILFSLLPPMHYLPHGGPLLI